MRVRAGKRKRCEPISGSGPGQARRAMANATLALFTAEGCPIPPGMHPTLVSSTKPHACPIARPEVIPVRAEEKTRPRAVLLDSQALANCHPPRKRRRCHNVHPAPHEGFYMAPASIGDVGAHEPNGAGCHTDEVKEAAVSAGGGCVAPTLRRTATWR